MKQKRCEDLTERINELKSVKGFTDHESFYRNRGAIGMLSVMRAWAIHEFIMKPVTMARTRNACKHCDTERKFYHES